MYLIFHLCQLTIKVLFSTVLSGVNTLCGGKCTVCCIHSAMRLIVCVALKGTPINEKIYFGMTLTFKGTVSQNGNIFTARPELILTF